VSKEKSIHSIKIKDIRQRILEEELREYEMCTLMTLPERNALRKWVRAGNSVHDNPSGAQYGGIGGPIDFLDDYRNIAEFEEFFEAMSHEEQESFLKAISEGKMESDLHPEEVEEWEQP